MDRFNALQLFTRIVELGSFTEAASVLNLPRATATHAIKELEKRLGARLLDRNTRQVKPTSDGQAFYERSKRVLAELEDAETSLSTHVANPYGTLRLDLHGAHATMIILPRIGEFRERYPFHRQLSPRVRVFIDWARDVYGEKFGTLKQHKHAR